MWDEVWFDYVPRARAKGRRGATSTSAPFRSRMESGRWGVRTRAWWLVLVLALGSGRVALGAPPSTGLATRSLSGGGSAGGGGDGTTCLGGCGPIPYDYNLEPYRAADDYDADGFEDDYDNCPWLWNIEQRDQDGDGIGDLCDSCPTRASQSQIDTDGDGMGDECDDDDDDDGVPDADDNCPLVANKGQLDTDADGKGDLCDGDADGDGHINGKDNCPLVSNPQQQPTDPTTFGAACDTDSDGDGVLDSADNCPATGNRDQRDLDGDYVGDACDADADGDGVVNQRDNCPLVANAPQRDRDRDGLGDACDPKFCYFVQPGAKTCLDPQAPFAVASPDLKRTTGDAARLSLFANRENRAISYAFRLLTPTEDGDVEIGKGRDLFPAEGVVGKSSRYGYFYSKGAIPHFTAYEPGEYQVELKAALLFADSANPSWPRDAPPVVFKITVEGPSLRSGCSMSAGRSGVALPLLLLLCLLIATRGARRRT
ncbi:MAG: thrombospondin type 3 repeat-containing protein [Myxococcales bacterium]|nr:thrombospondin type 3 repeat-containing protein [Myxococcales bacterium]